MGSKRLNQKHASTHPYRFGYKNDLPYEFAYANSAFNLLLYVCFYIEQKKLM